jgi:SAM-dependent methyltransferase
MGDDAAAFVGSIPQYYDANLGPLLFVDYAAEIARRAATREPANVLETAAGTGIVTRHLRDMLPASANLIATDLNAPMLEFARSKFSPEEKIQFQSADAMALPFADNDFDMVVCQFGMMFYPDKDRAYREVWRVLAPGGHYLFSVWDTHRYNSFGRITHELVTALLPNDPPQFMSVPFSYPFDVIEDSARAAGFEDINASVICINKTIPDARKLALGLIYGNPLIDQVKARGGIDPEEIVGELTRRFHLEFGADPGQMPLQAIVISAVKQS